MRKALNRTLPSKGNHKHHIFPKSIYGQNKLIVILTPREHFISHQLLVKIFEIRYGLKDYHTIKMKFALSGFTATDTISSKQYHLACKANSEAASSRKGKNGPSYGYNPSGKTRKKMALAKIGNNCRSLYWQITYPNGQKEQIFNLRKFMKQNGLSDHLRSRGKEKGFKAIKISQ